ncbi:MAG: 3'-5' exonuclease, partial [Actinomycetota bacterium]
RPIGGPRSRLVVRGDAALVRSSNVAVLARTHAQFAPIAAALADVGIEVRRSAGAIGSPIQAAMRQATGHSSPSALRGWAHDVLDDVAALDAARATVEVLDGAESARGGRARRNATADARQLLARVEAERRVASALLEFLRDNPRGDGAAFRTWVATTAPFDRDRRDDGGVELLTFHASKGREWHTVFVAGAETSLVPHKSATTSAAKAEEARLLYVAATRATDRLVITNARRRGGYERRPTPLLEGVDLTEPAAVPPPRELLRRERSRSTGPDEALRAWRDAAARTADVLPSQLCSDRDLAAIADKRPRTAKELSEVTSMGTMTAERLAPAILPLVADE